MLWSMDVVEDVSREESMRSAVIVRSCVSIILAMSNAN